MLREYPLTAAQAVQANEWKQCRKPAQRAAGECDKHDYCDSPRCSGTSALDLRTPIAAAAVLEHAWIAK